MKKLFQYSQLFICALFIFDLISTLYAWLPCGVFAESPSWCIGQIAIKALTYGLVLCFVTFIKKYYTFKTNM